MQAIVDKMRSDFSPLNIGVFGSKALFHRTERVVSASKGSPHNGDIFTIFFFASV